MCRLLAVLAREPVQVRPHLEAFAALCQSSREYQGHGWGWARWWQGRWERHRSTAPIWEDRLPESARTCLLLAHARSAFRDEGVGEVECNMPFVGDGRAFAFNGELHGVRLAVAGRTGAERIFNLVQAQGGDSLADGVSRASTLLRRRSRRIRACNFFVAEPGALYLHTLFDGEAQYFTLHTRQTLRERVICSEPYPGEASGWSPIPNGAQWVFPC